MARFEARLLRPLRPRCLFLGETDVHGGFWQTLGGQRRDLVVAFVLRARF